MAAVRSVDDARKIGRELREARKSRGLTLKRVEAETGVNVGQLSRFERGEFARLSPNLQKVMGYFAKVPSSRSPRSEQLVARFERILTRSDKHKAAARALLAALERFL